MAKAKDQWSIDDLRGAAGTVQEMFQRLTNALIDAGGKYRHLRPLLDRNSIQLRQVTSILMGQGTHAVVKLADLPLEVDNVSGHTWLQMLGLEDLLRWKEINVRLDPADFSFARKAHARVKFIPLPHLSLRPCSHEVFVAHALQTIGSTGHELAALEHCLWFVRQHRSLAEQLKIFYPHPKIFVMLYSDAVGKVGIRMDPSQEVELPTSEAVCMVYA